MFKIIILWRPSFWKVVGIFSAKNQTVTIAKYNKAKTKEKVV
jgi:hypothetical protein